MNLKKNLNFSKETKLLFMKVDIITSVYELIRKPLLKIFHKSIALGIFPQNMKIVKVTPAILPFRVWNHMWYSSRGYYCSSMFLYCTRVCINHRGVSDLVNNKLYVPAELFPQFVREDIVLMDKIYFFAHFHGTFSGKRKKIENNFGALYYESICSPFLLCKTYLEI